jgi:Fic family protein
LAQDRHSVAEEAPLLSDPDEIARREAENGIRQFDLALDIIRSLVKDLERPFRLRSSTILQLHRTALDGLHRLAGTWRNTPVKIEGSRHQPPEAPFVSEEIEHLCG